MQQKQFHHTSKSNLVLNDISVWADACLHVWVNICVCNPQVTTLRMPMMSLRTIRELHVTSQWLTDWLCMIMWPKRRWEPKQKPPTMRTSTWIWLPSSRKVFCLWFCLLESGFQWIDNLLLQGLNYILYWVIWHKFRLSHFRKLDTAEFAWVLTNMLKCKYGEHVEQRLLLPSK